MGREIVSRMELLLPRRREEIWERMTDLDRWQWRRDLEGLERTGPETFVEYGKGGFATYFSVTDRQEPALWAFDVENDNFTGRWTGELRQEGEQTRLIFTERVTMKRWVPALLVRGYLRRQQRRYGEDLRRALGI